MTKRIEKEMREIYDLSRKLFADRVKVKIDESPEHLEFTIHNLPKQKKGYTPKLIEVVLDRNASFMFIDDFRWEFDADFDRARIEIEKYIISANRGELKVHGWKLINERLMTE